MSETLISQAEADKYFETGGKEVPTAIVEAEKVEAQTPPPDLDVPRATIKEQIKEVKQEPEKAVETSKPDGEVQVNVEGKMVPLSELMAERKNRQSWEQTAQQQQQQLTEMLAMVKERAKTMTPAQENAAPDPNADPFGYINHVLGNVQATTQELQSWKKQQDEASQMRDRLSAAASWASTQEAEYTKSQPEYPKAYNFALEARHKELEAIGYSNPQERNAIIQNDMATIINNAIQQHKNPAELVFSYAKAKGFQIVAEQKKVPDLDDKVRTVAKGLEASKGLSNTSGGAPSEISSLADLAAASEDMTDDEFSKQFDKLIPKMKGKYV